MSKFSLSLGGGVMLTNAMYQNHQAIRGDQIKLLDRPVGSADRGLSRVLAALGLGIIKPYKGEAICTTMRLD